VTLPIEIKEEPHRDKYDYQKLSLASPESIQYEAHEMVPAVTSSTKIPASPVTPITPNGTSTKSASKSMIQSRKDYSYKYATQQSKVPSSSPSTNTQHEKTTSFHLDISQKQPTSNPNVEMHAKEVVKTSMSSITKSPSVKGHPYNRPPVAKEPLRSSLKPNISILERHNYNKSNLKVKLERENLGVVDEETKPCAINEVVKSPSLQPKVMVENLDTANILKVPIGAMLKLKKATESESPSSKKRKKQKKRRKEKREREDDGEDDDDPVVQDKVKVVVSQQVDTTPTKVVKQEPCEMSSGSTRLKQQTLSTESKDSQNINKINNKINIIFQLNDSKNNIILHRRVPKKMTKITIKEANNNVNSSSGNKTQGSDSDAYEATAVPEKILCTIETQTEDPVRKSSAFNMNVNSLLQHDDVTEHLFFEDDILICLQRNTISYFQYHRLSALLKKGETDFRLIDRIERRINDVPVDNDNKFQRLCYNDGNPLPIYVEMRAKQKELEDPLNCPIAFVYCNVYYIDQRGGKFSSVHLDTVKSVTSDICYATVPKSAYFIMAWSEQSPDTKGYVTGIVKYKLTPNLDLAKLAR
jgi:hypothetical protein